MYKEAMISLLDIYFADMFDQCNTRVSDKIFAQNTENLFKKMDWVETKVHFT